MRYMKQSKRNALHERHPEDFYITPEDKILAICPFLPPVLGDVLDPCSGSGMFEHVLRSRFTVYSWQNIDISPPTTLIPGTTDPIKESFFNCFGVVNTVISNPPFRLIKQFIQHGLSLGPDRLLFFARLSILEGKNRYEELWSKYNRPDLLIVCSSRPSFIDSKQTDRWAYAWFGWGDFPEKGIHWTP